MEKKQARPRLRPLSAFPALLTAGAIMIGPGGVISAPPAVSVSPPFLVQHVAIGPTQVAFTYAGDIWLVGRRGGKARRFTSYPGQDESPFFSPDGKSLAFSREIAGNLEVFVAPVAGGEERRLTFHPKMDRVKGWAPDGKSVLFVSVREGDAFIKLFTAPASGGLAVPVNLPSGSEGSFSPDGRRLAYLPISRGTGPIAMRYYRGGSSSPLWIADLETLEVDAVTDNSTNARLPFWVGDTIYFLWDETGVFNLYAYHTRTGQSTRLTDFGLFGIQAMSACRDGVVFVADRVHST
jgi:tricorn protease